MCDKNHTPIEYFFNPLRKQSEKNKVNPKDKNIFLRFKVEKLNTLFTCQNEIKIVGRKDFSQNAIITN